MSIRASAAACDISPEAPLPLGGFSGYKRISSEISHPLLASAVHIRGGAGGCMIIALDLFSLGPMTAAIIRQRVSSATGTRLENVFVSATGCHAAPYTEDAIHLINDPSFAFSDSGYVEFVIEKSVKAAAEAAATSRPASMAVVDSSTPGTGALIIKGGNGRVIAAVIVNDDMPDYMGSGNTTISSDSVGCLRVHLTRRFGNDSVIAYIPAPCGDQLIKERADYGEASVDTAGKALSDDLISRIKALKPADFLSEFSVHGATTNLYSLPRRSLPHVFEASANLNTAAAAIAAPYQNPERHLDARWALIEANRIMSIIQAADKGVLETALQACDPTVIQSLRIGPVTIIGVPCLIFRDTARQIITQSPPGVWLAQCVNGTMIGSALVIEGGLDGFRGRLLSPVFEHCVGDMLIAAIMNAAVGNG